MFEDIIIYNVIIDKVLVSYFRSLGNLLEEELVVLGQVVINLMFLGDNVNNKNIILSLIYFLEIISDIFKVDVIRKILEIVLRYIVDDM